MPQPGPKHPSTRNRDSDDAAESHAPDHDAKEDALADEAGDESFPASDPPAWTPGKPGSPAG